MLLCKRIIEDRNVIKSDVLLEFAVDTQVVFLTPRSLENLNQSMGESSSILIPKPAGFFFLNCLILDSSL